MAKRIALVTGAASGIGAEVCRQLAAGVMTVPPSESFLPIEAPAEAVAAPVFGGRS